MFWQWGVRRLWEGEENVITCAEDDMVEENWHTWPDDEICAEAGPRCSHFWGALGCNWAPVKSEDIQQLLYSSVRIIINCVIFFTLIILILYCTYIPMCLIVLLILLLLFYLSIKFFTLFLSLYRIWFDVTPLTCGFVSSFISPVRD